MFKGMILIAALLAAPTIANAAGPAPVFLGEAAHFTILAGAAVTTTGGGIIDGDVGAYPIAGSAIGIPPVQVNGTIYARDATGTQATNVVIDADLLLRAKNDMHTAWVDAAGRTPVPTGPQLNPNGGNLGGLDLAPGLYKITTTTLITGSNLILRGGPDDVWIFLCDQNLVVGSGIQVTLAGGALAKNIFWQVGTSAVLGTGSVFKGTIIADAAVVMESTSTLEGRALAFTEGVTFDGTGGMLPSHEMTADLDADNSNGIAPDFAGAFSPGSVLPVPMSDADATITNTNYEDLISLKISSDGIVDGGDESVIIGGEDFPLNADKTATVIKGLTTFQIEFASLTGEFTITRDGGGRMPIADLNSLIRDLAYMNTSVAPTLGDRTFAIVANDGMMDSNAAISTISINLAPMIDLDADDSGGIFGADVASTFTGGDAPVSITDPLDATIDDHGGLSMASLTITADGMADGADEIVTLAGEAYPLHADKTANVVKSLATFQVEFVSLTGVFTITGVAGGVMPLDALNDLLRDLTYENASLAPTPGDRTFEFVANDGIDDSNLAVSTVTVNNAPMIDLDADDSGGITGADFAATFTEGDTSVTITDPLDATIADNADLSMASLVLTAGGIADGADEIVTIAGEEFPLNIDKTANVVKSLATFQVEFVSLTGVFTITGLAGGVMPLAALNDLLRDLSYANTSLDPTPGDRTFEFVANDGIVDSNIAVSTITVVPTHALTVVNGTGSGVYTTGAFVPVIATIPAGQVFDVWSGDIGYLADPAAASTIATMPAFDITVSALFVDAPPDTYALTVVNGTGSGAYAPGAIKPVIATIPAGKVFDTWSGDIGHLTDPAAASTLATMPAFAITVSALFVDAPPDTYALTVVNGTGSGAYAAAAFVPVIATIPAGKVFDTWAGNIGHLADPTAASTIATMPAFAITVSALFADAPPETYTLTVVNGTGSGSYAAAAFVPVIATIPVGKVFDTWAGDIGHLADPTAASTIATMPAFAITLSALFVDAPPDTYSLTIVNGTGSGAYAAEAVVPVIATVPAGKVFDVWVGDTSHLADPTAASTLATMPAFAITVSALFVDALPDTYTLTVVNGNGSGAYFAGTPVPIAAIVPAGRTFIRWAGDISHLADPLSAATTATMPAFAITIAAVLNAEPPWYPRIPWTPVAGYDWYNFQIWDGVPEANGASLILETHVMRSEMTPAKEYLLITSDGILPGNYFWRYRTWLPNTDTYGTDINGNPAWLPAAGAKALTVDYRNPPVNDTQYPVVPHNMSCTPNPGLSGNFSLEFLTENSQGYDLEIRGRLPQNNQILHDAYFMPGADKVVPFNVPTQRTVTLVGPDTCTWRVRGFNPHGDSEWSSGPDITVTAANIIPPAGVPDYNFMRPTDGWWVVVAAPGGSAPLAFAWNSVPGAAGYMIYVASADGVPILNYVDVGNVTRVDSIGGVPLALPAGTYLWCLVAYNGASPRVYGGWNHSPRTPTQESPIFFQVIEDLEAPTISWAEKGAASNTVAITWVGIAPATVDVLLFYPGSGGWLQSVRQPVTATGALTGTIPLGRAWGTGTQYILLTGQTATGLAGPRSRMFVLP